MQRAFYGVFAALARKLLGTAHLASPPFGACERTCQRSSDIGALRRQQLIEQFITVLFALGVAKCSSCAATNCYCESAGLSSIVSKTLAEVCEWPSNEKQQHQLRAKHGDKQSFADAK